MNDAPRSTQLPKAYDPKEAEQRWYEQWSEAGVFTPVGDGSKKPYVIMMPPPNVTGTLHNGHALFVTLQDVLIRYHRMLGEDALWLPGVDHAGIATQAVVERELRRHENKTRHDLGREAFLQRVWAWKERNGSRIVEQLKVIGASADWTRERFTMDEQCSRAVREAFVRMWNDGLIFRGERLVNWDPITHTALSNEEVEYEERDGELWSFAYPLKNDDGQEIVVATTRPETMLGDTAVAVHPDDDRYRAMVGKSLVHPFFPDRDVKIIADKHVDPEFGSGAVKITPAHDPNDFEIGARHDLQTISIFDGEARVNENGGEFAGLDRFAARDAVKAKLDSLGWFRGTEKIRHKVSMSQRSGEPIEPMISRQYFVNAKPLAKLAIEAVDSGKTRILPETWKGTWNHFMHNIRDWCISRQLWWGHRIPVFYDVQKVREAIQKDAANKGIETTAARALASGASPRELLNIALRTLDEQAVRSFSTASTDDLEKKQPERFLQEEDVLDTWFSSGLWPFSTLGWPEQTEDLKRFYPGAVLETGFDIIFFWVARMMMMGCYFMKEPPFADVFLHAMVRDANGNKMSKSQGNAIDPLDVIGGITLEDLLAKTKTYPVPPKKLPKVLKGLEKEYPDGIPAAGADGLRFSLAALSGQGRDVKLAIPRVAGYRNFLNKIWNATRFALMRIGDRQVPALADVLDDLELKDRWILSRLQRTIAGSKTGLENYRFDETANHIYQFFWSELCDWYIELSKDALAEDSEQTRATTTASVLIHVLDASMRLAHPICPFQSEEIWQRLPNRERRWPETAFCAVAPYPEVETALIDEKAERELGVVLDAISLSRRTRQDSGLPAQKRMPLVLLTEDPQIRKVMEGLRSEICRLAYLDALTVSSRSEYAMPKLAAANANAQVEVVIPLEGLIDLDAERARLQKEIGKSEKLLAGLTGKLSSKNFVDRAPAEVVAQTKSQKAELDEKLDRLRQALHRLST